MSAEHLVEDDAHAPAKAYSFSEFPDWVFIRCACGESPISNVWLREHWTGDPEAGKSAVHDLIAAQAEAEKVPCTCGASLVSPHPNDVGHHSTTECIDAAGHVIPPTKGDES